DTESIRRCIGCVRCIDAVFSGALRCTVNPFVGKESEMKVTPAKDKKKILVIGGGPVGLESAILCARRGHKVTLVEKNHKLGGQVNSAAVPPHKYEVGSLITTQTYEAEKLGVEIITGVCADTDFVKNSGADEVIVATGARHIIPDIPGVDNPMVTTAVELLEGKSHAGKNVVIIGGNMIGCETAEFIAEYGKKVTILEMLSEIGQNMAIVPKPYTLSKLNKLGVEILTEAKVTAIEDDKVIYERDGNKYTVEGVDTVVLAAGMESVNELAEELKSLDKPVHVVGDASNVSIIMEGLASVYDKLLGI
ncbi:MAG: FAD-dependent oxidoreductase, partial [Thermoanaerobacteraceae bacterium]|nr:FAD-dependent oxidoreductase [Thermoanaerobacteraceae bacterium]